MPIDIRALLQFRSLESKSRKALSSLISAQRDGDVDHEGRDRLVHLLLEHFRTGVETSLQRFWLDILPSHRLGIPGLPESAFLL